MAGNESGRFNWEESMLVNASHLTPAEKAVRDKYVEEYLLDYDPPSACMRMGYVNALAIQKAFEYMDDPYVRQRIAYYEFLDEQDPRAATARRQKVVQASLFREAHRFGSDKSHGPRVKALSVLAGILDMNAPIKTRTEVTHRGGVMLIPAVASVSDWEKAALKSQEKLVTDARD